MDITNYLTPNTEKFIDGYGLLKDFLIETKSHFSNDSIEIVSYDGKKCDLKLRQECEIDSDLFSTIYPAGYVELLFHNVTKLFPSDVKKVETYSYHASLLIDTIKDSKGNDCGICMRYIHDFSGDDLFRIESKSAELISFKREKLV